MADDPSFRVHTSFTVVVDFDRHAHAVTDLIPDGVSPECLPSVQDIKNACQEILDSIRAAEVAKAVLEAIGD